MRQALPFLNEKRHLLNQQILIYFKSCNHFYTRHCLYIDNMLKIPRNNNIAPCKDCGSYMLTIILYLSTFTIKALFNLCKLPSPIWIKHNRKAGDEPLTGMVLFTRLLPWHGIFWRLHNPTERIKKNFTPTSILFMNFPISITPTTFTLNAIFLF